MNLPLLRSLFGHMEWADASVWRTVIEDPHAGEDDWILDNLLHLHVVQRAYLSIWKGESLSSMERSDFTLPEDMRRWAQAYYPEANRFLGELDEERLDEVISIPWTRFVEERLGSPPGPATLGDMVFQVATHSVHHRAQVNRRIREVGGSPGLVDYIAWIWLGRPAAAW